MDDYQELKQLISILEQRIADLERMSDGNGAGNQNAAFVPIPQIANGDCCAFQLSGTVVGEGGYLLSRRFYAVSETNIGDISNFTGYIVLSVHAGSGSGTTEVKTVSTLPDREKNTTVFPLYKVTNGSVVDLRACPHVQYYE